MNRKIRVIEIGDAKEKPDTVFLQNKEHTKTIILHYSFEELDGKSTLTK